MVTCFCQSGVMQRLMGFHQPLDSLELPIGTYVSTVRIRTETADIAVAGTHRVATVSKQ